MGWGKGQAEWIDRTRGGAECIGWTRGFENMGSAAWQGPGRCLKTDQN